MKLKILFLLIILIGFSKSVFAAQILPKNIIKNTVNITASRTGEVGKNYFYCKGGKKCSTEQVVREYFENEGYNVMRAEYSFWSGMFELSFLNEYYQDVYEDFCKDKRIFYKKFLKDEDVKTFINRRLSEHENDGYVRELDEWEFEDYKNSTEYFKSPIVQEFLDRIDKRTFGLVITRILSDKRENLIGTPDYIIWNDKNIMFVEVKRKNEKLSDSQIKWGEFLIKNRIRYKLVRVVW